MAPFGRKLALFRTAAGRAVALDARCSHLGADLAVGTVIDAELRCPFHHWCFDSAGECSSVPYAESPPRNSSVPVYPVEEYCGIIWVYAGEQPDFQLPRLGSSPLARLPAVSWNLACHHHLIVSNALDLNHWRYVHGFNTEGSSSAEELGPHAVRLTLRLQPAVKRAVTRLVRAREIEAEVTLWGANIAIVEIVAPWRASVLIAHRPQPHGGTRSCMVLGYPRRKAYGAGLQWFEMIVKSALSGIVIGDDRQILNNIEFWPRLSKADGALAAFYQQVNRMPRFEADAPERAEAAGS